jgi:hypothetical protein
VEVTSGHGDVPIAFHQRPHTHFARVTVAAKFAPECSIAVSEDAYEDERAAARSGATFALHHIAGREGLTTARVVIERIESGPVDTTPDDIACATCRAVWQALGVEGSATPPWPG